MHSFILNNNLKPGDVVLVPKTIFHLVAHYGVYLGQDHNGNDLFSENNNLFRVRLITANKFFADNPVVLRIRRFTGSNYEREVAVKRALNTLGKPCHLINFNCEHFANYDQSDNSFSDRVKWAGGVSLGILALFLIFGNK